MYQKGPGGACLRVRKNYCGGLFCNVNIKPSRRIAAASSGLCSLSSASASHA